MEETLSPLAVAPPTTETPPPPPTSPIPPPPILPPPPPARPQRRAATRALISLSKGYIPLRLSSSSSSSSETEADTRDEQPATNNDNITAAKPDGSVGASQSSEAVPHSAPQPPGQNISARTSASRSAGGVFASSDTSSDGYVAGQSARRGAKRKHHRNAGAKRKAMRLDRDDWRVIAGARASTDGNKMSSKAQTGKKNKDASALEEQLTREEMATLLGFVGAELDWEKAAAALGGGESTAREKEVKTESREHSGSELREAGRGEGLTSAKSAAELKRCWSTDLTARLLRIYK